MANNAERDQNSVPTLLGVSNSDGVSTVTIYADPTTHRLLIDNANSGAITSINGDTTQAQIIAAGTGITVTDNGSGTHTIASTASGGTVTSVSVVSANGLAGTVATATTTPAITLSTTVTGLLQGNGTTISAATNTGSGAVVLQVNPILTTPTLGVASATSINKVTITAPASGSTLTIADGKTLTIDNSLELSGTDGTTMLFPTASQTVVGTIATQTLSNKTLTSPVINTSLSGTAFGTGVTTFLATPTSANLAAALTDETGTGASVFGTQPTLTSNIPATATSTTASGTTTFNMATGNVQNFTFSGSSASDTVTFALSNVTTNQIFTVSVTQNSGGSGTVTWFSTVRWTGGTTPTLTTTASKRDTFGFICTGTNTYDGFVIGQNI